MYTQESTKKKECKPCAMTWYPFDKKSQKNNSKKNEEKIGGDETN